MRVLMIMVIVAGLAAPALSQPGIGDVEVLRDLAYGPEAAQRLDAYLQRGPGSYPIVVYVHGGGFVGGDKRGGGLELMLPLVLRNGYSVVSINYRLAPAFRHPAQADDGRLAVRWVRSQAPLLRVDPDRLALAGASAGGHIATFVAFAACPPPAGIAEAIAQQSCRPQTVVNFFGPTDLRGVDGRPLTVLLGPQPSAQQRADASPVTHVSPDDPPTLSLHGTADRLVPYAQSVALHRALAAAGVPNRLITVSGGGHGFDWFTNPNAADWQRGLVEWLDLYLKR